MQVQLGAQIHKTLCSFATSSKKKKEKGLQMNLQITNIFTNILITLNSTLLQHLPTSSSLKPTKPVPSYFLFWTALRWKPKTVGSPLIIIRCSTKIYKTQRKTAVTLFCKMRKIHVNPVIQRITTKRKLKRWMFLILMVPGQSQLPATAFEATEKQTTTTKRTNHNQKNTQISNKY